MEISGLNTHLPLISFSLLDFQILDFALAPTKNSLLQSLLHCHNLTLAPLLFPNTLDNFSLNCEPTSLYMPLVSSV